MNGNTSVLYLQEIDNFTDDQLLRILQELKTEFEELKRSDIHQESLITPAFAFSLVGIFLTFCLCKKDRAMGRKLHEYEEKVSNDNLEAFKQELVQLCREEYLSRKRKAEEPLSGADISRLATPPPETESELPLRAASLLTPSVIYIPTLAHRALAHNNKVFDPTQEARPVTAGDIELAWKHKFEKDDKNK